jgi:preprotein translocase subunit SecG
MILAVLVQNPKSGMAANFGASNQVMGVRQTADFLEKFTWGAAATVLVLSLLFTVFIGTKAVDTDIQNVGEAVENVETVETPANN